MATFLKSLLGGGSSWPPELFSPQPNGISGGANALHPLVEVGSNIDISSGLTEVWNYDVPSGAVAVMVQGRLRSLNTTSNVVDFEIVVDGEVVLFDNGASSAAADFYVFGSATSQPASTAPFRVKNNITVRVSKALSTAADFEAAWYLVKA